MRCPNGKAFILQYRKRKREQVWRQEEVYQCEDCPAVHMQNKRQKPYCTDQP